jgi:SAM-dependent methyltransferase
MTPLPSTADKKSKIAELDLKIVCPYCKNNRIYEAGLYCDKCHKHYALSSGRIIFEQQDSSVQEDPLEKFKDKLKNYTKLYIFLQELISPVYISKKNLKQMIRTIESDNSIGLNIGSGVTSYSTRIVNFDKQTFKNVDIVGDLYNLPFADNSFDYIFSIYVLEHIAYPQAAINEMYRVLKPGGICYAFIPFIQGFHASPHDYVRLTKSGVESYFADFRETEISSASPTGALLWIFQEWISIALSFGNRKLHLALFVLFMTLTFPLKFIDIILSKNSISENIASVHEVLATK